MAEEIFRLPRAEVKLMFHVKQQQAFAVAGGRPPLPSWLRQAAKGKALYCADRGAEYCLSAGLVPAAVYGDCDSASRDVYSQMEQLGGHINLFSTEKDDTDLQLLLDCIPAAHLTVSGVWGGRFDHLYSNVFSLLAYKLKNSCQVIMADERETMVLLAEGEAAEACFAAGAEPKAISLLPLEQCAEADISGVHWPLSGAKLELLRPYAVSNVKDGSGAVKCRCRKGSLGLYFYFE